MAYLKNVFSTKRTPQSEPIPGTNQVRNSNAGFSFPVDDWVRLERFLILGSEGGSYYATERKLTFDNAKAVQRCVDADGLRTVARIVAVSEEGRAPKNDPAILALAIAASFGDDATRGPALVLCRRSAVSGRTFSISRSMWTGCAAGDAACERRWRAGTRSRRRESSRTRR
jgi:60 kDa SS-A/Ro ribonucleoprotein